MRREYVQYKDNLPISMSLLNIKRYPLHWKNAIEIVFVLEGEIDLAIDEYSNNLVAGDIEIINVDEVRSFNSISENNKVLIIDIEPEFFERYYVDAKYTFFYTDIDPNSKRVDNEKKIKLKKYISILLFELITKSDNYDDHIEEQLVSLMYFLLNNYHYLFYEGENLEEDDVQLERYHRIIKYLNKNYMYKVSLQDIADKEFLSPQYLSYKIKDTFGLGFNEYLNNIRAKAATKLLLSTDRSISDISNEVGFSHVRYFNRYFELNYNMDPSSYREKYKVNDEELEKLKNVEYLDIKDSLDYVSKYLKDYDRFFYESRVYRIDVNLDDDILYEYLPPQIINLSEAFNILEEENHNLLEEVQKEINFKYALITNLFSSDMDIYLGGKFINWTKVENVLNYCLNLNLIPIIDSEGVEEFITDNFILTFSELYDTDVSEWLDPGFNKTKPYFLKDKINHLYDKAEMIFILMDNFLNKSNQVVLELKDEINKHTPINNDTFFGGQGLFTNNGLNKASYYSLMLLSLLGDNVIYNKEGCIVTTSDDGYEILVYNNLNEENSEINNKQVKKVSVNLYNMKGEYQVSKYTLNRNNGSPYDKWEALGSPERLDVWNKELLKRYVHPKIYYYYKKEAMVINIFEKLKPCSAVLYKFYKLED